MSIKDEKAADLAGILDEVGEPVVWNGRTFKAIITSIESSETLQIGGFSEDYDFTVKIAKAVLGCTRPKLNDTLSFDGDIYRVTKVSESPAYPLVTLTVKSK